MRLILIRGLPGSGKSTLAKHLVWDMSAGPHFFDWSHFEADQYFVNNGDYLFDPNRVADAHKWCQKAVEAALLEDENVIVSNTFSRIWEMKPYIELAERFHATLTVITCEGNYGNVHGVSDEVIQKMRDRWERYGG